MTFRLTLLALAIGFATLAPAAALTPTEVHECQTLASGFTAKQAKYQALSAERDALALKAETLGEAWENAEQLRHFSPEAAAEADEAEVVYEDAKIAFETSEAEFQTFGAALNSDIQRFNTLCAAD